MNATTRDHLEQAGLWEPSAVLSPASPPKSEDEHVRKLLAERAAWIRAVGSLGWQQELNRRRAARIASHQATRRGRSS